MLHKSTILILILSLFSLSRCSEKKSDSELLGDLGLGSPVITSIDPPAGSPPQSNGVSYTGTQITIKGRNFAPSPVDSIVMFNDLAGTVLSATTEEIITTVPNGAKAGFLTVSKTGGICDTVYGTDGFNCSARRFYVDCYKAYANTHGDEIAVNYPDSQTIKFTEDFSTKAFRSNLREAGGTILTFECDNLIAVTYFSTSCTTAEMGTTAAPVYNPSINFADNYAVQYFVTSAKGNCKISFQ
ncbi:IPT/TIG domain-containing protein [Leptospira ellisii]|uniref:DNA-binding protein n=2 Tax=Leptospira ellisii TaxID=2023197 RepID=A0A2N0BA13_9LEPT|nr:IPT/TIG domain-containing protein [Leptospira ellisii]MDV6234079.1 IPT/TIG domain-containing protein [Leptospira ellisii]PJZ93328.1 DNA-binding protein [Leptospira ellisii]